MLSALLGDLRGAVRGLRQAPSVALSAVLCLGLALGATTAIWSAIDRALLQPLPFRAPERLVTVYRTTPHFDTGPFSAPNYADLARDGRQVETLAAATPNTMLLALSDGAAQVGAFRVTGNFFPMLGASALVGRLLGPTDDRSGENPVVVLGEPLWRERFGADPSIVGRQVQLDGIAHTVVGVAPPRFGVPHGSQVLRAEAWIPMRFGDRELGQRRSNFLYAMGRLAPGATVEGAHAELRQRFDAIVAAHPQLRGEQVRVVPLRAEGVRTVRTPLLLVLCAVGIVLLIAATNVASLLLARSVHRRREIAIRAAMGGSRWRVMRPALAEAVVVIAAGLGLGLLLAWVGVRTIGALAAERLPQLDGLAVDLRVAAFAVALSVVVAVLCGAAPAWRSAAVDPQEALSAGRGGGAGRGHHRALRALVVGEVALSLVLLIGAGLVLRGFATLLANEPGFDPRPILTLQLTVDGERYPDGSSARRFLEPALAAVREVPGVAEAGAISVIPYENWGWNFNIRYEGQPGDDPTTLPLVEARAVTPEFFGVTRQRLVAGRLLAASDDERPEAPAVVVVNEALVKRDFAGRDPVGQRFHTGDSSFATIVGVVSDIRNFGPVEAPRPEVYHPYPQIARGSTSFPVMVRVEGVEPTAVAAAVRQAVRRVDPGAAVTGVQPMTAVIADSLGRPRFYLTLLAVFAAIAAVLAVAGLYGVMSYAVAQRTREFGIRSALGSDVRRTLAHVTREGMTLIGTGLVVGLAGGWAATRLLGSLLYGVSPLDARAWGLATLLLAAAGLLAALLPARRAARVDPVVAMQVE